MAIVSQATGNWGDGPTWVGGIAPSSSDQVEIVSPHTVTLTAPTTCAGIMVDAGATLACGANAFTDTGTGVDTAGFRVDGSITSTANITVNGSGCVIDAQGSGSKTVTTSATAFIGGHNKSIASTANITFAGAVTVDGAFTVTNNGTVTITGAFTGAVSGSTWINAAGSTINISSTGSPFAGAVFNVVANPNTVNFSGANQTPRVTTYDTIVFSGSGTKTLGALTANTAFICTTGGITFSTPESTTVTIGGVFRANGSLGNLITFVCANLISNPSRYTFTKSSGVVDVNYCSITRCVATGGARWLAGNSVDVPSAVGNNSGWVFYNFPVPTSFQSGLTFRSGLTFKAPTAFR